MIRLIAALLLIATPALAWETVSGPICELSHQGEGAEVLVTYDPEIGEYAIAITPDSPWSPGPVFAIRFDGAQDLTITTTRHELSDGGATLTVRDVGFGNVLDGLEFNDTAIAILADRIVAIPLVGAAPSVQAFRTCTMGQSI